jgi:hypothetical protein
MIKKTILSITTLTGLIIVSACSTAHTGTASDFYHDASNSKGAIGGGYNLANGEGYIGASPGTGQSGYWYPNQAAATKVGDVGTGVNADTKKHPTIIALNGPNDPDPDPEITVGDWMDSAFKSQGPKTTQNLGKLP